MIVVNIILKYLNYLVIAGLLLAYAAPYINPSIFWPAAFFGLFHPVFLFLNLLFLIYWLIVKKLRFVFNLAALVLGISSINKLVTFGAETSPVREGKLKVVSFNAKLFGIYEDANFFDKFLTEIAEKNPDVLCIQEFYNLDVNGSTAIKEIKKSTGLRYHYLRTLKRKSGKSRYGIIVFSKNKIVDYGDFDFGYNSVNLCLYADIKVDSKIIRIYNIHLQSLKLARTDYALLKKIGEDTESTIQVSKNIYERLKTAFIKRGEQAILVKENMKACHKPIILCGDFNDTPQSFAYNTLSENMKDCFMESGNGIGGTYTGPLPTLRIDYIFHDTSMVSYNYLASKSFSSDHKMIETVIDIK